MKNLADLKRQLVVGAKLELIAFGHMQHKYLNQVREIKVVQTNSIMFEEESWLNIPKKTEVTFYGDDKDKFKIQFKDMHIPLIYKFVEN